MTNQEFTHNIAYGRMKRRDWVMIVCVAIVDAPRIIDSYIGLHGDKVHWELWPTVHGLTGLGMACIAGLSIAQCLSALAPGRATQTESSTRNLLMALTVAAIVALGLQVLPPILGAPADGLWRVVWAVSAVASPLLVVAATPVAHTLEQAQTAQPAQPVVNIEALRSEWRADIARSERKQTLHAVQVNVHGAQVEAQESAQAHDVTVSKPVAQLAEPAQGRKVDPVRLADLLAQRPTATSTELAREFGVKPQAIRDNVAWKGRGVQS